MRLSPASAHQLLEPARISRAAAGVFRVGFGRPGFFFQGRGPHLHQATDRRMGDVLWPFSAVPGVEIVRLRSSDFN